MEEMEGFGLGMLLMPVMLVGGPILGVIILVGLISNPRLTLRRMARAAALVAALLLILCSVPLLPTPKESADAWVGPIIGIVVGVVCAWLVYLLCPRGNGNTASEANA